MNISELTIQQKDAMLADLLGWKHTGEGSEFRIEPPDYPTRQIRFSTFYHPSCMEWAWAVLNWTYDTAATTDNQRVEPEDWFFIIGGLMHGIWAQPPAEAMAAWLDKILEMVFEAGLMEVSE